MTIPYSEPELNKDAFNCPLCNAYASFKWMIIEVFNGSEMETIAFSVAKCRRCDEWTLWTNETKTIAHGPEVVGNLIYPLKLTSPLAHNDLPEPCRSEYEEARNVLPFSTRAAAALLRLCIQKLCKELGGKGKNINEDIGSLVRKGLDEKIQKALDIVRVTGNNAVHPGIMEIQDDKELVDNLFKLVNMIVEETITKPNEINQIFKKLPEKSKEEIVKRDSK